MGDFDASEGEKVHAASLPLDCAASGAVGVRSAGQEGSVCRGVRFSDSHAVNSPLPSFWRRGRAGLG